MPRLWKMGKMGLVRMGKLSQIVPFSPIFLPLPTKSTHFFYIS